MPAGDGMFRAGVKGVAIFDPTTSGAEDKT